ncbi:MAG TPA: hypothetical protein VJC12_02315 [Candidatus Paceibacterota bacterium]
MVLTTHQVVGAAVVKVFSLNPVGALFAGIASHYFLDSLPHWDYSLSSGKSKEGKLVDIEIGRGFVKDLFKLIPDLLLGLFLSIHFFSYSDFSNLAGIEKAFSDPILWGAVGGILPDALQFLYFKIRRQPLIWIQKFHDFFASPEEIKGTEKQYLLGIIVQVFIIFLAVILFKN